MKTRYLGLPVLAGLLMLFVTSAHAGQAPPASAAALLGEARNANSSHDIELERSILLKAEGLVGTPEDSAEVQRRLAVIDWKYYARFDEAGLRLLNATERAEPCLAFLALARMEQARERFGAAREAARAALGQAKKDSERRDSRLALARAWVTECVNLRLSGGSIPTDSLRGAFEDLRADVTRESGYLEPARLLLRAALLLNEGETALTAWRAYFHVTPGDAGPGVLGQAGSELERLLPAWAGPDATSDARKELIQSLATSRLFTEAALVAVDPAADSRVARDPAVRGILAYERALRAIDKATLEYYRQTILGKGDSGAFEKEVRSELASAIHELSSGREGDTSAEARPESLYAALGDRFGAYVNLGTTAGYFDLHMGHRVTDEDRTVDQYGHQAKVRFIVLDCMVSNGFQSWAWESGNQHGGWANANEIYQVRPAYANGSLAAWRALTSEAERKEFEELMARESGLDEERARKNPNAYLPGLAMRLGLQGLEALYARIEARGLEGSDLRMAFIATYEQARIESSIFAHEGRHALQKQKAPHSGSGEFEAKLSEVAFAPEPRLALGAIFDANIGDDTPHGKANLKIMKGLNKWMKKHSKEIEHIDASRPLLAQFDLLTDDQIREAFRSMDGMALPQHD